MRGVEDDDYLEVLTTASGCGASSSCSCSCATSEGSISFLSVFVSLCLDCVMGGAVCLAGMLGRYVVCAAA